VALRVRRVELRLSQQELARRAGVSVPLISMIERQRCRASSRVQLAIAGALAVPVEALFDRLEPRPARSEQVSNTCATCGRKFRVRPSAARRRFHCSRSCLLADPRIPAKSREAQDRLYGNLRAGLIRAAGGCGSPLCTDRDCAVPFGHCHRDGCGRPVAIARATSRERRHVLGQPLMFCSRECSGTTQGSKAWIRRQEDFEKLRSSDGLRTMSEAEAYLDRSRLTIAVLAKKLGIGLREPGVRGQGARWLFSDEELDLIAERMQKAPTAALHADPRGRATWYFHRFRSTRLYGRLGTDAGALGAADGIEAGRAKGGRPPKSTPEQQQEMLRLDKAGLGTREIAERVFGDSRFKNRVHRFLNR
jgi:transcriptional regulator with XRE-family HTH domain